MTAHDPRRAWGPAPGLPRSLANLGLYLASHDPTDPWWDELDEAAHRPPIAPAGATLTVTPAAADMFGRARTLTLLVCAAHRPGTDEVCWRKPGHRPPHTDPDGRTWHD